MGRVLELARFAATAKVTAIERMGKEHRAAALVALVSTLEATGQDDALDVLVIVLTDIFSEASKAGIKARLRTLKDLDAAAVQAAVVTKVVLDPNVADSEIRQAVFKLMSRADLETSVQQIDSLVRPPEDVYYNELRTSYRRVRRFLPALLQTVKFGTSPAGQPLIEALGYLKAFDAEKKADFAPPLGIVDAAWRGHVICDGKVDLQAYTFCFLDRLRKGLRRRDLFAAPSVRYADPRVGLLEGETWEGARPFICRSLGLPTSANEALAALRQELEQTYRAVAANFPNNTAARIEQVDGKDDLILTGLDKLDEPESLIALRKEVQRRLPRNTNANNQLDNKGGNFTHALALNTLATTTISGVDYYGFILDINQVQKKNSSDPLLSLDKLQIFTTNNPSITGYNSTTAFGANADKVYDLDGASDKYIKLDSSIAGSGSGSADMSFFLKKSLFTGKTGNYLVLYSSFGAHFASNGGFQEWAALTRDPVVSGSAPLPSTAAMGALLLAALGIFQWHQNRYQTAIPAD